MFIITVIGLINFRAIIFVGHDTVGILMWGFFSVFWGHTPVGVTFIASYAVVTVSVRDVVATVIIMVIGEAVCSRGISNIVIFVFGITSNALNTVIVPMIVGQATLIVIDGSVSGGVVGSETIIIMIGHASAIGKISFVLANLSTR